jgi:gamma-glutamyl hercynylcysteine S-oxide hydrolase
MCRHIAYLGPPASLRSVLLDPPHSLYRQAWAPRLQRHGTVNADGFGVGWYAAADPVPARYRRSVPIWGDSSFPDIARVTRSGAVLAAVRSATEGTALGEAAAAPFGAGPWLFSHNGLLDGWPAAAVAVADRAARAGGCDGEPPLTGSVPQPSGAAALLSLEAMVDSAFLWTLVLGRLRAGCPMGAALVQTIAAVEAAGETGRFNFLLTDGHSIAATACGDTLWYRQANEEIAGLTAGPTGTTADPTRSAARRTGPTAGTTEPADCAMTDLAPADGLAPATSVTVASEPSDDEPGWIEVPGRHLLTATPRGVNVQPLAAHASTPVHQRPPTVAAE